MDDIGVVKEPEDPLRGKGLEMFCHLVAGSRHARGEQTQDDERDAEMASRTR